LAADSLNGQSDRNGGPTQGPLKQSESANIIHCSIAINLLLEPNWKSKPIKYNTELCYLDTEEKRYAQIAKGLDFEKMLHTLKLEASQF